MARVVKRVVEDEMWDPGLLIKVVGVLWNKVAGGEGGVQLKLRSTTAAIPLPGRAAAEIAAGRDEAAAATTPVAGKKKPEAAAGAATGESSSDSDSSMDETEQKPLEVKSPRDNKKERGEDGEPTAMQRASGSSETPSWIRTNPDGTGGDNMIASMYDVAPAIAHD